MRAYRLARPAQNLPGVGSFDDWAWRVRDLVAWLLNYDLSETFQQNKQEDPHRQDDAALLAALHDIYGAAGVKSADVHAVYSKVATHKRAAHLSPTPTPQEEALHAAIENAIGTKDITAKRIGQWARRVDGAFIGCASGLGLEHQHHDGAAGMSHKVTLGFPGMIGMIFSPSCISNRGEISGGKCPLCYREPSENGPVYSG
jgi:hypothetical protein